MLFDASEAVEFKKTISPSSSVKSGELSTGQRKSAEIRPLSTLSACSERAVRGSSHVENMDASVLGGERGGQRLHLVFPAICHYKGNKSPPSSDCYRPRDGNRILHPPEDASGLLSGSGRRLMKHPALKITPAERHSRPSAAALIGSGRQ